jgi:hypothetical protein
MYVANVCSNVSYVCLDVLCKSVLSGCYIYFTHMLQVFYLDVVYVCNGFKCFCMCFIRMFLVFHLSSYVLLVLYLNVSKVDQVLHFSPRLLLPRLGVSLLHCILLRLRRGRDKGQWRGRARGWQRGRERVLSPSLLFGQRMDTASLFCYCEQHEIGLPLVGHDTRLRLVESFISWLVGGVSGHVLSVERPGAGISVHR